MHHWQLGGLLILRLNRTIVGLKDCRPNERHASDVSLNRTIVGLKDQLAKLNTAIPQSLNRTIVGLNAHIVSELDMFYSD